MSVEVSVDRELRQSQILRRYVDLPKLLDLLHSKCLYLRRADGFADRLEGALFPSLRSGLDESHARGESKDNADDFYRKARTGSYVSCWSIGARDNMALWQLYGGAKTCVAVTTTVERLVRLAREWNEPALLHKVQYVDHRRVSTYVIGRYTDVLRFKNDAFKYEEELRLVVPRFGRNWKRNPLGLRLPIADPNTLVRSIVLAPEAEPWFIDAIQGLCAKYGLKSPVRRSTLATLPT
jgi:hypothetical protein